MQVLKLSQSTVSQLSIGHIVNLASNDVKRFDLVIMSLHILYLFHTLAHMQNFEFVHEIWAVPLFFPLVLYLLWREVGSSCLAILPLFILLPPIQYIATRLFSRMR